MCLIKPMLNRIGSNVADIKWRVHFVVVTLAAVVTFVVVVVSIRVDVYFNHS